MLMNVVFGAKTDDIEQAREWVERATGLKSQERESVELGGEYYSFDGRSRRIDMAHLQCRHIRRRADFHRGLGLEGGSAPDWHEQPIARASWS
jgi:hypothetical protein